MKRLITGAMACVALIGTTAQADAYPVLQLDIVGGYYDQTTQTTISSGPSFQLVALLTPKPGQTTAALREKYFISVALSPQTGPTDVTLGSFFWNGNDYDVTQDMIYGVPPIEGLHSSTDAAHNDPNAATHDGGDLGQHSIYPTFFREFEFSFSSAQTMTAYNTETGETGGAISYYQTFDIVKNLPGEYQLHFDLYNSEIRTKCSGKPRSCLSDEDVDKFAPFSHDAESGNPPPVPEPASMALLGAGLAAGVLRKRRQSAAKQ